MVCHFCPNSGSTAEKSFNRADVFKRHLTSVHGVEQSAPNSRKKAPSKKAATQAEDKVGKCSTCSSTFSNAQEFYDHLDDCVLKFLDKGEPSEEINEQHLKKINNDRAVKSTLEGLGLPTEIDTTTHTNLNYDDDDDEEDDEADSSWTGVTSGARSGKGSIKSSKRDSS
jgi:hypothetical protein